MIEFTPFLAAAGDALPILFIIGAVLGGIAVYRFLRDRNRPSADFPRAPVPAFPEPDRGGTGSPRPEQPFVLL